MKKRIFTIATFFFVSTCRLYAQTILGQPQIDYTSKSADIQSMQKAVDFPVNYFNGSADINIPLYTLKARGFSLPVSVQYNTGGIKADQQPSCVGLGWLLQAGGSVTRTVRGNFDEGVQLEIKRHPQFTSTPGVYAYVWATARDSIANVNNMPGGYYVNGGFNYSVQTLSTDVTTHNTAVESGSVPNESGSFAALTNGLVDGESDIYYFSFGSYSGRFVFDRDGQPVLMPYNKDIKIVPQLQRLYDTTKKQIVSGPYSTTDTTVTAYYYFKSFVISTPDGKDFYFGETHESRNITAYGNTYYMPNGWLLTKVVDRILQDTVTIDYVKSPKSISTPANRQKFVRAYDIQTSQCVNVLAWGENTAYQNVEEPLPAVIKSKKEKVVFYYGTFSYLDSIKVFDAISNKAYQKIQFSYAGFLSGKSKLAGLFIKDLLYNDFYPYSFDYYDTVGYMGNFAQDFWGYQNRASNGQKLFLSYPGCSNGANRLPAWPEMKIHALTQVTYPTGKKTEFEYEPHRVYTARMYNGTIGDPDLFYAPYHFFNIGDTLGGLRIKKIVNYDPITKDTLVKSIDYSDFDLGVSSGHLYIPPSLVMAIPSLVCNTGVTNNMPQYYLSTHNLFKGNENGNYVGYRNVTIREEKGTINNGYIRYEYYNDLNTDSSLYMNICDGTTNNCLIGNYDVYPSWQPRHSMTNLASGYVKSESIYNTANQLISQKQYQYRSKIYPGITRCAVINIIKASDVCGNGTPVAAPPTYAKGPVPAPQASYYYFYSYTIGKKAIMLQREIDEYYAANGTFSKDTINYNYENSSHINPTLVTKVNSNKDTTKHQMLYAYDFADVNNGDSAIYFMKKGFYNPEIASFEYVKNTILSGGYKTFSFKSRADSVIFLHRADYRLNTSLSGFTPAALNIGTAYPKSFNFPAVNFQQMAAYHYNSANAVTGVVKKGNNQTAVLWDYNNYFAIAEVSNADSSDIAFTSFETANSGNWTVGSGFRVNNEYLTGTLSYNLANGNISRSGLNPSRLYTVSYWSKGAAATVNSVASTAGLSKNGWTYYQHLLPSNTTSVTISGSVIIDELRLYPVSSLMYTNTYDPMVGITAAVTPDNLIEYSEYDGLGNIRIKRDIDRNIIKSWQPFFTRFSTNVAEWYNTGTKRLKPCPANTLYNAPLWQYEQIDINPNSGTYNTLRWVDLESCTCNVGSWQTTQVIRCVKSGGVNTGYQEQANVDANPCSSTYNDTTWTNIGYNTTACPLCTPNWQNTATPVRCKKDASNINTGEQEQEQIDTSPCSPTYNQVRWVVIGVNTTACPLCGPNWQFTATPIRCKKDGSNQNTGEQEREQRDIASCSATYNQLRWIVVGTNITACPLP